jgi:2-oxoglutarate dehydrogenase E2 component (dihydrolipoamide succinyltransferase)
LKEDVSRVSKPPPSSSVTTETPVAVPAGSDAPRGAEEVVPMSLLRRKIAERLVQAQHTAALLTTFNEIDMSTVMALRQELQESFQKRYETKLGFMSFFVKAVVEGLQETPQLNAEVRGTDIVYRNYCDIGVAIGGGRGLVVPVVRNAENLSFAEIELAIAGFARKARENKLRPEDLQGGTFTITNGGVYGSMLSTPLINPPQSGVLGMHAIQDRPVALNGQVVIRPIMYVALTYDHRIVDGREAVTFLRRIKEIVENPVRLLVEV